MNDISKEALNNPAIQDAIRSGSHVATSIIVPLGFFLLIFGVIFTIYYLNYRKQAQIQKTLQLMVEKGVQLPESLITAWPQRRNKTGHGIVLACLGLSICIALFVSEPGERNWIWGIVPLFLGLGYLTAGFMEARTAQQK
jgi:uncharacterized membrane protein HdeD (DUF308 family)